MPSWSNDVTYRVLVNQPSNPMRRDILAAVARTHARIRDEHGNRMLNQLTTRDGNLVRRVDEFVPERYMGAGNSDENLQVAFRF